MRFQPLTFCLLVVALWGAAATSFAQSTFVVSGTGPSPEEYRIYPPGVDRQQSRVVVTVDDVAVAGIHTCEGLDAKNGPADNQVRAELRVRHLDPVPVKRQLEIRIEAPDITSRQLEDRVVDMISEALGSQDAKRDLWPCLVADADGAILLAVRAALPRTLDKTLTAHYGFSAEDRYVDLVPGMRLCVDYSEQLRRSPETLVRGGSRQCFLVGHGRDKSGQTQLGFDAFLDRLDSLEVVAHEQTGMHWVSGKLDLADTTRSRPFYRLFWPVSNNRYGNLFPDEKLRVIHRPVLVGIATKKDRDLITMCRTDFQAICENETSLPEKTCCCLPGPPAEVFKTRPICHVFREWGVPVPEISVRFQSQWTWVPLGTTLLDLLERTGGPGTEVLRIADSPQVADARAQRLLSKIDMKRRVNGVRVPVVFRDAGLGALYLPLIQGDEIEW